MKKLFAACLAAMLLLTGCGGELTDAAIAGSSNSYSAINSRQTITNNTLSGTVQTFSGIDTVWTYEAESDCELEISYLLSVAGGKAKFVLISPDKTLTTIVENADQHTQDAPETATLTIKKGKNRIKLVAAEKAQIGFMLTIDKGELDELG